MIGTLSKTETATLLRALTRRGSLTQETYEAVMGWASAAKLDADILELVLQGFLEVDVDEEGVLRFLATELGLASDRRDELERIEA